MMIMMMMLMMLMMLMMMLQHNLAIDTQGHAYSLPSQLSLDTVPPGLPQPRVTQVVCGKVAASKNI